MATSRGRDRPAPKRVSAHRRWKGRRGLSELVHGVAGVPDIQEESAFEIANGVRISSQSRESIDLAKRGSIVPRPYQRGDAIEIARGKRYGANQPCEPSPQQENPQYLWNLPLIGKDAERLAGERLVPYARAAENDSLVYLIASDASGVRRGGLPTQHRRQLRELPGLLAHWGASVRSRAARGLLHEFGLRPRHMPREYDLRRMALYPQPDGGNLVHEALLG